MDLNFEELEGLSPAQKELVLKMLQEYADTGNSNTYTELVQSDYEEVPVDIETFLHDKQYLGNALYDQEGRFTVFPYWEEKLKEIFPTNTTTEYNTIILTGAIGLGKAQPLDALILTTAGYKQMGSLTLNDKVFGVDGKAHSILGIFPQGKKNICKVTFTDNTSTLCCDEHLWTVYNTKNQVWTTVETRALLDGSRNLKHTAGRRYKIPMTQPVEFKHQDVYIDPYILGVLLGDGNIIDSVKFASNDLEIVDQIKNLITPDYEVRKNKAKISYSICKIKQTTTYNENKHTQIPAKNLYFEQLEKYGLNVKTEYKYIPQNYLFNDIDSRIALLQGLMDTDGYISKDGSLIEFTTISERLKNDFVFLVQSLGGICHIRTKRPSYKNKVTGERIYCNKSYNIGIKLPSNICPFRLSRKASRISNKSLEPFRYIKSIEYLDEQQDCQCIYIDSKEHLYLTNDFIVTHNTMVACICLLYLLYRLLCLKDPYLFYGMQPIDKISISLMNITLENAKGVALDKMNQMILSSSWFMAHGDMGGTTNLTFRPEKHIELITASSNNQVIGRALFANFTDEVNFGLTSDVEKLKKKQKQLISQIDARMKSRFMRGTYLPTLNIIASSKNSDQSFLDDYINNKKQHESTTTLIVDEPQWVVDSRKDSPIHFYVAVGNKFLSNELLPKDAPEILVEEYRAKGYQMLEVPIGYYENFQDNIDGALTDIAGIATASSLKYISGVRWNEIKIDTYENPFIKEIIEVGTGAEDTSQYYDFFDLSKVSPELMAKPLYIHLDMSIKGDKTGIGGTYVIGKKPKVEGQDSSRELFYQVAFNVSVKAPKGREISFDKNRAFIRWLRDTGFNIKGISCDTFQSAQIQQQLIADGFNVETISVDRLDTQTKVCLPYAYFKSTLYDKRLSVYRKCDLLTDEVLGLERESDGHIQHPEGGTQGCFTGDTKVSLLDGRDLTFLELINEFNSGKQNYVYSFNNQTKTIEPKLIQNAWCTIKNAKLVEVELDNGEKLKCTPNHKFMLRTGEYCEAQYLKENDSLMPLYRKYPTDVIAMKNYRMYYEPIEDAWHYEHRRFATNILDEKYLVHYWDVNPNNNSPNNLFWCSKKLHQKIHALLSTGSHSVAANIKRSESIKKWHEENKGTDVYINRSKKLHVANLKQFDRTEEDYIQHQLQIEEQHQHGIKIRQAAEEHKLQKQKYISKIETLFNVVWADLSANEQDGYAVKLQRLEHPETQEQISKAVIANHAEGKYENAYIALNKCNQESKKLKELCPIIDKEKFYTIFGIDYDSIPSKKWAPWAIKYRKVICKTALNHKVVAVRVLDYTEDVYDITVQDNHNFALAAGVFVHNSKDSIDAIAGSLWNASQHADEFAFEFGESIDSTVMANTAELDTMSYATQQHQIELNMEEILKEVHGPMDQSQVNSFTDFGLGSAQALSNDIYLVSNGIIV